MIFIARPITVLHIRDVCTRFNEGVRVEYKRTFDQNVRDQVPKIISSFANSQGGTVIIGVRAVNGVPQEPIEGFEIAGREEFPLTIDNFCLSGIYPPVLPRIEVVHSDLPNHIFLVIEVDESGEAPHAIENSRKVYVRTGNAANPYDLAEVDHIIDLMKRRKEPQERSARLLDSAEVRSHQFVSSEIAFSKVSICPVFPRKPLCTSQQAWEFLLANRNLLNTGYANSLRRIPDGAASTHINNAREPNVRSQYEELNSYGLFFAARQIRLENWAARDDRQQIAFADLFQPLLRMILLAERFYATHFYTGSLDIRVSLNRVAGRAMRFVRAENILDAPSPDEFRCYADVVVAERVVSCYQLRDQRLDVLTDILSEITWAFWQSMQNPPTARLRALAEAMIQEAGV